MRLSRLCAVGLLLLPGLGLVACGEARRPVEPVEARAEQEDEKEKKDEKDEKKEDKKDKDEKKEKKPEKADLGDVHAEVTVLQVFHALDLKDDQLEAIGKLAAKTAQKPPLRKEWKASDKYRKALLELRTALQAADDAKIETATANLDAARKDEDEPEYDEVEITAEARKQAPGLFEKLNARQVVFYLTSFGDGFPDPLEKMTDAMAESRKLEGKEWRQFRDDVAYQVAWLIAGVDLAKEEKVREKIADLLDNAHDLKEGQYEKQKEKLEKSARELVGKLNSTDVIRHYVERMLAETLSNHRLAAAVEGRKK